MACNSRCIRQGCAWLSGKAIGPWADVVCVGGAQVFVALLNIFCLFMQDTITANSSSVDDYKISRPYLIVESREFCFTL